MSDLIERNNAINAIVKMPFKIDADGYNWVLRIDALKELEDIPSANSKLKKGKWVKVQGFATPGGDPVWKCSECGKGIHVYGIENNSYNMDYTNGHQWVACPNCGANMSDEDIPMEYFESGGR